MRHLFEATESKKTIEPKRTGMSQDYIKIIIDSGYTEDIDTPANIVLTPEEAYLFAAAIVNRVEDIQREKVSKLPWWKRILS